MSGRGHGTPATVPVKQRKRKLTPVREVGIEPLAKKQKGLSVESLTSVTFDTQIHIAMPLMDEDIDAIRAWYDKDTPDTSDIPSEYVRVGPEQLTETLVQAYEVTEFLTQSNTILSTGEVVHRIYGPGKYLCISGPHRFLTLVVPVNDLRRHKGITREDVRKYIVDTGFAKKHQLLSCTDSPAQ